MPRFHRPQEFKVIALTVEIRVAMRDRTNKDCRDVVGIPSAGQEAIVLKWLGKQIRLSASGLLNPRVHPVGVTLQNVEITGSQLVYLNSNNGMVVLGSELLIEAEKVCPQHLCDAPLRRALEHLHLKQAILADGVAITKIDAVV